MMRMTTQSFFYKRRNPQDSLRHVQATCFFVNILQIASEYTLEDQQNSAFFGDASILIGRSHLSKVIQHS